MAQRTITEIYVNVSGGRPQSQRYIGSVGTQMGQVMQRDMDRALDAALEHYDMHGRDGITPASAYAKARIVTAGVKFSW